MSKKVKICGVNSPEAFDAVVEAGADYLGFVFFERSPRCVTAEMAARLSKKQQHKSGPHLVGLFVEPKLDEIRKVLAKVKLDVLQVHASDLIVAEIKREFGLEVWRSVGMATKKDFPPLSEVADGYVAEAKPPPGSTRPGGNAVKADWELLRSWKTQKFWLVAGGLTPRNVFTALETTNAPGADVSSGVESAPGEKSPELIRQFVAAVRRF